MAKEGRNGNAYFVGGLNDDDHSAIRDCNTLKDMFTKLKSLYETKTEANKYLLNQALHAMKFKNGQSVQSYCSELSVIVQQLEAIGEKISDTTLVAKLINVICLQNSTHFVKHITYKQQVTKQ